MRMIYCNIANQYAVAQKPRNGLSGGGEVGKKNVCYVPHFYNNFLKKSLVTNGWGVARFVLNQ